MLLFHSFIESLKI